MLLGEAARGRRRATLGCGPLRAPSDATSVEGLEAMTTSRDDPRDPRAADVALVPATRLPLARQIPDEEATTTNKARAVFLVLGSISQIRAFRELLVCLIRAKTCVDATP